jgi:pyridinium-3,5-biscarboxylic acid mononucleotide sulfurtransferase
MSDLPPELAAKCAALLHRLAGFDRVVVAYSGGVDSAVVARAAREACGERARAVTAVSASLAQGELEHAQELARLIGIAHEVIETREFDNPSYIANPANRCYHCKTELYNQLDALCERWPGAVVVNGANVDDLGDWRPGLQAAREHQVDSPLVAVGISKAEVRALAKHWQLPAWDKPASPCLSSRVAYGIAVTPERLARIDASERFIREELGLRELRVRLEANELARIEVPLAEVPRLFAEGVSQRVAQRLRELGFRAVCLDLEGFRSGSLNDLLPVLG